MSPLPILFTLICLSSCVLGAESFEAFPVGGFCQQKTKEITFLAQEGHVEIHKGHAHTGSQSLRMLGGDGRMLVCQLKEPLTKQGEVLFWAERWTRKAPFHFWIEEQVNGRWSEVKRPIAVAVGGMKTQVALPLKKGASAVRMHLDSAHAGGLLIDDLTIEEAASMRVVSMETFQPVVPVMRRLENNPVMGICLEAKGSSQALSVSAFDISLEGTSHLDDVAVVRLFSGKGNPNEALKTAFGRQEKPKGGSLIFKGKHILHTGKNYFWVSVQLKDNARIDGRVDAGILRIALSNGQILKVPMPSPQGSQRIGVCLAQKGDGHSGFFRIPGMATTPKGTLVAVYDNRYHDPVDLPADIDIAANFSKDGGQTWSPNKVIIDMGNAKRWNYDGVGDPAILVDKSNGRIWVAALWSHGNRAWNGSGAGIKPEETGQLVLSYSDDEAKSWSKPFSITEQVKSPEQRLFFNGPGRGICTKEGVLVFAAQYRDASGMPYSTIIYSKNHGKTWQSASKGVKSNTTESQVVELADGSIMINCRDNRGGWRSVATTRDWGNSWQGHSSDRKALPDPICMGSLLSFDHPEYGHLLLFSNPNTPRPGKAAGRYDLTLKVSSDEGISWPKKHHFVYDVRSSAGYSCLTGIDKDKVGILYEGVGHRIFFLRISLKELLEGK